MELKYGDGSVSALNLSVLSRIYSVQDLVPRGSLVDGVHQLRIAHPGGGLCLMDKELCTVVIVSPMIFNKHCCKVPFLTTTHALLAVSYVQCNINVMKITCDNTRGLIAASFPSFHNCLTEK